MKGQSYLSHPSILYYLSDLYNILDIPDPDFLVTYRQERKVISCIIIAILIEATFREKLNVLKQSYLTILSYISDLSILSYLSYLSNLVLTFCLLTGKKER